MADVFKSMTLLWCDRTSPRCGTGVMFEVLLKQPVNQVSNSTDEHNKDQGEKDY